MKILVTGGSGYLGVNVTRLLNAENFSRRSGRDVLDSGDVGSVAAFDVVIHLAAMLDKSPQAAEDVFRTNVEGTKNILLNVRAGAAFIFASTKDVYGRFADNYAEVPESCPTVYSGQSALEWSKLIAERYVEYYARARGFRSCIYRMSNVYAPRSPGNTPGFAGACAEAIDLGEQIVLPYGNSVRDFLHVDDFSRACLSFVDSGIGHGLYNIGGGAENASTLSEFVAKLEQVSGLQAVVSDEVAPAPVPVNYVSDLALIRQELGWQPEIKLEAGLASLFRTNFNE